MRKLNENEIAALQSQGCTAENWQDIQVGDTFEVFEYVQVARHLNDSISENAEQKEDGAKE